ncbi:MAG: peptide ABC transporter substrate-binding protein [Anaerolineae bacterium]|nr:peptide ABC transporter substrate-binding protein [Anaerolineae bacterium]
MLKRNLCVSLTLCLLTVVSLACRQNEPPPTATPAPGATRQAAPTTVPPTATPRPGVTPLPTATITPIPPTATPTPDRTREAESRIVTLDYRLPGDPPTLDPMLAQPGDEASQNLVGMLFMRLSRLDPTSGQPRPWLAREWAMDGVTVTVKLRDDVPWVRYNATARQIEPARDGQGQPRRVEAADVVYAVRRALDPKNGADTADLLYILQGAREYQQAGAPFDRVGVRALDTQTVQFVTTSPAAYFPTLLTLSLLAPVPQWAVEASGTGWAVPDKIVTNGPYALAEWTAGKQVTLLRNPQHPDRDKVQIERLRFPIVPDLGQAYTLFSNGNLDSVEVAESERANAEKSAAGGLALQMVPNGCTTFVGLTTDKLPLDRPGVRKALAAAIDRKALVDRVVKMGLPSLHLAPAGVFEAVTGDDNVLSYAPDAARRFLAEAGFPDGRGFPTLTYAYNTCDSPACKANQAVAEALRDMWQQTLNIQVKLDSLEWPDYLQRINRRTPVDQMPHAWRMAWCEDFPDEHNWLYDAFYVNAPGGYSRGRPGRFDELVAQAAGEPDAAKRADLYREAERVLMVDEARVAPLFASAAPWVKQPWLSRQFTVFGGQNFDEWKLDWEAKRKALGK